MQAIQLTAPKPIEKRPLHQVETAVPTLAAHQIRVKVHVCGVCHTDLHTVEGDLTLPRLPLIPGHQIVGTVDALGDEVTTYQRGDRVGIGWLNDSCRRCEFCQAGLENLCPHVQCTGLHVDGGYAQYALVAHDFAFPLPAALDDVHAAPLLCAGIVGYRALRLSQIQPGQRLGLYGFGASAHLAIQVARHWDCEVYVFTRSEAHREHARALGAAWAGSAKDEPPEKLHAGVTFAPVGWIVPLALGHLRPGGTLAINAIHTTPIPEMPYARIYEERVLRSVTNFTRYDAEAFLTLAGKIPIETTVTAYPLTAANEALHDMKESQLNGAAVLEM